MEVKEVMTKETSVINALDAIAKGAKKMQEKDIGWLPVMSGEEVVGAVTDRDIVVRGVAEGLDVATTPIKDVSSLGPVWCYSGDSLQDAAESMKEKKVRRLLVVDNTKQPVGVVSIGDLATEAENDELLANTLEEVSSD